MIVQVRFTIQISYNMIKNQKLSNSFLDDQLLTVDRYMTIKVCCHRQSAHESRKVFHNLWRDTSLESLTDLPTDPLSC